MKIYNVYQSGKRLYIDEKEIPDNKIVVNKYDNMQQTLRLISDGTLPPRLYWALRNPKLSNKYFILKLVNNEDLIVGTDISAYAGLWDMLLIGTDEDYIIEGADIDQSRLTYVSDHFGRLFVRDNFLEELDFEEQCSPTFKVFYDEIMFRLDNIPDLGDIPDKMSDLENDTNFISGVALKDDGEGHVEIIGTTFSGGETEEGEIPSGGSVEVDDKLDEESTNPVQNQVIAKEVNSLKQKDESLNKEVIALRERNAELEETVEKLQIKTTTSPSPFHHITDSANMKVLDFGMEGKTEQETTSGKNLCDLQVGKRFNPFTGEIGESANYAMCTIELKEQTDVTISIPSTEKHGWYLSYMYHNDVCSNIYWKIQPGQSKTITLSEGVTMLAGDAIISETTLPEFKPIKIQIELGTTATDYEPYTGAQPTPNPDYPQEIVNAGKLNEETGRYEIGCKVVTGNLLPNNAEEWLINYTTSWSGNAGTKPEYYAGLNYKSVIIIDARPDTTMCFHNDTTDKYWIDRIIEIDNDGIGWQNNVLYYNESYNFKDYSFKTTSKTYKLIIQVRLVDDTQTFTEADLQEMKIAFGYGNSVTYTPHASQQFTLTSPVPLTKWDKLVKRDGVYGWSIWSKHHENITSGSIVGGSYNGGWLLKPINLAAFRGAEGVCNIASYKKTFNFDAYSFGYWQDACPAFFYTDEMLGVTTGVDDNATAIQKFKTNILSKGITVICQMNAEQAFHPLPDEEQTLLNNIETYYGVTNVYNEQGCPITLSYISDPELHWNQKLEQINNALLSLGANV